MRRSIVRNYTRGGYGGFYQSEALPRALPKNNFNPQHPPYGLYPELLSGTAFTLPRVRNQYSWVYRIHPSVVKHGEKWKPYEHKTFSVPLDSLPAVPPIPLRAGPVQVPVFATDFMDGLTTMCVNGEPRAHDGATANVYACTKSMERVFTNNDGDMLILPQEGNLIIRTEYGELTVEPTELALIPKGMPFQIRIDGKVARGYVLENFGAQFIIPDLGPIGISTGLAHPSHFLAPSAKYEDNTQPVEAIIKTEGALWQGEYKNSPFDVVGWFGNYVPVKYDMKLFMAINTVTYGHPDPSIGCVLTSQTNSPGLANIDFVIFPPRYVMAEDTFRPPWYHRNVMSEYMGLIKGSYDAKPGFTMGASSIHNQMEPHGPDEEALKAGSTLDTTQGQRYCDTLAFMWESNKKFRPTEQFLAHRDLDYQSHWAPIPRRFDPNNVPPEKEPLPFPPSARK